MPYSSDSALRRWRWISGVAALLFVAIVGCAGPPPDRAGTNARLHHGDFERHNVLVVTIDTLRADRVGAYGGGALTPTLDRLAASGVRFSRAYTHAPLTLPAHTSIFTGLTPASHGVHDNGAASIDARVPTLAERLHGAGYRTGAFVGAFVLDARFGLSRGFDVYDDHVGSGDAGPIDFAFAERTADRVTKAAGDWILRTQNPESRIPDPESRAPWFAWVHLFDPHAPYRQHEPATANPYDGEVAFADQQLGAFLGRLRAAGQLDRTLIVVLADHGESLGEHGEATHGLFAYNATLHIPLIVAGPPLGGEVVDAEVAQSDVLPTILDLLGVEPPPALDGRSLLPAIRREPQPARPIYFEALDAYLTRDWAPLTGVVEDGWKYIDLPEAELYDLGADPSERHNVLASHPRRVADLQRALARWHGPAETVARALPPSLDRDAAARLRALGYAGVPPSQPSPRSYSAADDPKRLLDLNDKYERAMTLTGDRRYDEAIGLLRSVIAERPTFALAYINLASVLMQNGDPRAAIATLEAAIGRGLTSIEIPARLGIAYLAAGDPAAAVRVLDPIAARPGVPLDALNTLGIALSELGRTDQARQRFAQVVRQSPGSATSWNNLGLLEMSAHRPREAAAAFAHAVVDDPALGPAWQGLGAALAADDPGGAIDAWRHAEALLPRDYDLLFNLAVLLHQQGRREEARPYIERFVRDAPPERYARDIATLRAWLGQ